MTVTNEYMNLYSENQVRKVISKSSILTKNLDPIGRDIGFLIVDKPFKFMPNIVDAAPIRDSPKWRYKSWMKNLLRPLKKPTQKVQEGLTHKISGEYDTCWAIGWIYTGATGSYHLGQEKVGLTSRKNCAVVLNKTSQFDCMN